MSDGLTLYKELVELSINDVANYGGGFSVRRDGYFW